MLKIWNLVVMMYELAVWDADGKQYLPLFGYNDEVVAYAPALEAIAAFQRNYM